MNEEKLFEKIKLEGGYQDVEVGGKLLHKGWRSCEQRWHLIKTTIGEGKTVIDYGSHYGYFAHKIAQQNNVVLSIEGAPARAEIQRGMLELNNEKNVYLCERQMSFRDWFGLYRTAEGIDFVLALSVLHYLKADELFDTLWLFSGIAPNLIVEYPPLEEKTTAAYENVVEVGDFLEKLKMFYDEVIVLGEVASSSDPNFKRIIYHASNPKFFKTGVGGYLSYKTFGRRHRIFHYNGKWSVDEKVNSWVQGLNANTPLKLNIIYPTKNVLIESVAGEYMRVIAENNFNVTDVSPRNAILTPNGIVLIDWNERVGEDIYELPWEEYKAWLMELDRAQITELLNKRND